MTTKPPRTLSLSLSLSFLLPLLLLLFLLHAPTQVLGQGAPRNGKNTKRLRSVSADSSEFRARQSRRCPKWRTYDGVCTSKKLRAAGSVSTAQFSYFGLSSTFPTGINLPSARRISNIVSSQVGDKYNARGLSEFVVFFGQFLDHTLVATTTSEDPNNSFNIEIPSDDPIMVNFSSGFLPMQRNERAKYDPNLDIETPINTLPAAVDLASVYGPDEERATTIRLLRDGLLEMSTGNLLPFNTKGLFNSPTSSPNFFLAGDHRANEHVVLTAFHTLFAREHNKLAVEVKSAFPEWSDEKVYQTARQINIAQYQKIVYEEFLPVLTGRVLPKYRKHRKRIAPVSSVVFSAAAFRLGHTMVGDRIKLRGANNVELPDVPLEKSFFNIEPLQTYNIDAILRGATYTRAQEVDTEVVDLLRNMLFQNVEEETGFDLIALNLQRGRDAALPSYNTIRKYFTGSIAYSFADISSNPTTQSKLATAYEGKVDDVEAWIGMMAEDHLPGGSLGPTVTAVWEAEFKRLRDGDRLFYKKKKLFGKKLFRKIRRLREIYASDNVMAEILFRNTLISSSEIAPSVWHANGYFGPF